MLRKTKRRISTLRELSLMLAMFFLPLGYDFLFKFIMEASGSYWMADIIFYSISGFFWLCFILLSRHSNRIS